MKPRIRWSFDGIATLDNTVVGSAQQGAGGEYFAYGMLEEWEDVPLGVFRKESTARREVEAWVKDNL